MTKLSVLCLAAVLLTGPAALAQAPAQNLPNADKLEEVVKGLIPPGFQARDPLTVRQGERMRKSYFIFRNGPDAQGYYAFGNLRPGTYGVSEAQPGGYLDGLDSVGSAGGVAPTPGDSIPGASLPSRTPGMDYDFGEIRPARLPARQSLAQRQLGGADEPEVTFDPPGRRVVVTPGSTLLEVAERNDLPIEAGCRMGLCGADPVTILAGMEHLSALGDEDPVVRGHVAWAIGRIDGRHPALARALARETDARVRAELTAAMSG